MIEPFLDDDWETYLFWHYSSSPHLIWGLFNPYGKMPLPSRLGRLLNEPCTLLINTMHSLEAIALEDPEWFERSISSMRSFLAANAKNKLVFLGNTPEETALLDELGLETSYSSQNQHVNERVFIPILENETRFDAIYNAQFSPFKRHELATDVSDLGLVYALWRGSEQLLGKMKQLLPNAVFLNNEGRTFDLSGYKRLSPSDINFILNKSGTTLCLSRREGACFSSIESLLSGVPVVSTSSFGGRDKLFPVDASVITMDTPEAIAGAVRGLLRRKISKWDVRSETLRLVQPHRDRFEETLMRCARSSGCDISLVAASLSRQRSTTTDGTINVMAKNLITELRAFRS